LTNDLQGNIIESRFVTMIKNFTYTNYLTKGEYFKVCQFRPKNKQAREVYYFFMIAPISIWIVIASSFLPGTITVDIYRILQGCRVKFVRNNLKNKRMQEIIKEQQKTINANDQKIGELTHICERTKADLQKLVGLIENVNNDPTFVAAYLKSVIKTL
jgi:ABC-type uncharacterized transport system fused permease/ATPase subunit